MMNKTIIRKAKEKDFDKLARLFFEYEESYGERWTNNNAIKTLKYYNKIGKIYVISLNRNILGLVIFREEYYNTSKKVMVEELIINSKKQSKGLGRKLMNFVEEYCKKNKISNIWLLTNTKAKAFKFYKILGYEYENKTAYFSKDLK
jgi:N-acetylglutamate synthase-like GNAT family acetyltransferase